MLHLLLKWLTTMDRAEETVEQATGGGGGGRGRRRQPIAGKINILALAAHGEQQALMQPGDAPVTPGHGD